VQTPVAVPQSRPAVRGRIPEAAKKSCGRAAGENQPHNPHGICGEAASEWRSWGRGAKSEDQGPDVEPQEIDDCKNLRQDYPIEVPGVPLTMDIQNRKSPENEQTIRNICQANKDDAPHRNQQD